MCHFSLDSYREKWHTLHMIRYERVNFVDEGNKARSVMLRVLSDTDRFLTGYEVDRDGEEISGRDFDRRTRIIDKTLIRKRMEYVMDLTYGTLKRIR